MANEKSRNHAPTSRNKGGDGKAQGKRDSDKSDALAKSAGSRSASKKPGPGKQLRDQLNVRTDASAPTKQA